MFPDIFSQAIFKVTVGPNTPASGFSEDSPAQGEGLSDLQEVVSLKERMARYQEAVSRGDCRSFSANMMEESEMCTVPGGLAKVKKHFEDEITSSQNAFAQYQYQQQNRSEQKSVHSAGMTLNADSHELGEKAREGDKCELIDIYHETQVSHLEKHTTEINQAQFHQYVQETVIDTPEDEDIPKVSTKLLKKQFEKSAQEKMMYSDKEMTTPAKQIKIDNAYEETLKPSTVMGTSSTSCIATSQRKETSTTRHHDHSVTSSTLAQANASSGKMEEFPPPPLDALQAPIDMTAFSQSPEFPSPPRRLPIPKDLYSKQRNLYELNRLYKHIHPELRKNLEKDYISEVSEIVSSQMNSGSSISADVQQTRYIFENTNDSSQKDLSSEREYLEWDEILKGEVQSIRWVFENQPLDSINSGSPDEDNISKGIADQEIIAGGDVKYTTWMFETQPIDTLGAPSSGTEENAEKIPELARGDVRTARWMFETKPLDTMNKMHQSQEESAETIIKDITGGDVKTVRYMFETQHLDQLGQLHSVDEVHLLQLRSELKEIKGNVKRSIKCFETQPLYVIRDGLGQMLEIKTVHREDVEKGDVRTARWMFETQPLDTINKDITEIKVVRGISMEENVKGGVSRAKWLFETQPLEKIKESEETIIEKETIIGTDVSRKCWMFETQPLDILKEVPDTDLPPRSCRWLFETRPIDQFDESIHKFQIIRGISAQEIQTGNVKSAKWLFETQPLDSIKYFNNVEETESKTEQATDIIKGDVKTCKWLFETQPMESLYEKVSLQTGTEEIYKGDVKTCTWLFENQPLDTIKDDSETTVKSQTVKQEEIQGGDVRTACFLFETENLDSIQGEEGKEIKPVEMEIQAGDVSSMRYKFENQSLDSISSSSEEVLKKIKTLKTEDIQKGNVLNCRWLFENQPIDMIKESQEGDESLKTVTDIQGGDVRKRCFIFETFSLDEIKEESDYVSIKKTTTEEEIKGDVKSYRMLFETQPLYAIQDREGHYHEVTTVKKEEVIHGDVRGTRWLFETKPLDSINDSETVYVIKSVTQEDVQKGDVSSVRYRFETQPLDQISEESRNIVPTVDNIQGGDVKTSKQFFESENFRKKNYIRTVSVNEIQKGNVKTSTWLFETHTIEELRGEGLDDNNIKTVTQEDVQKGDVKQAVWLFENQTLDSIKEADESITKITKEEIPPSDVKTTTWLFETTPLHEFNETRVEKVEIIGKSIRETLEDLYSQKVIQAPGIIIEADEVGDVRMAKYKLMNQASPQIQKEEIVRVDLRNIMVNLLSKRDCTKREILVSEEEKGNVNLTKTQLLNRSTEFHTEKEEIVRGDVQQAIKNLFSEEGSVKKGIVIQEDERGDINMTIYCLLHENDGDAIEREEVIGGDVRRTIHNLLSSSSNNQISERAKIDASERGNVQFFTTCIETGALDYLRQLQTGSDETLTPRKQEKEEEIIGGDVEGTKLLLQKRQSLVERTVSESDIIPGDVQNAVKVFMTEPQSTSDKIPQKEIIKGDLTSTLNSLRQAINQKAVTKTEETIKGNMLATLKSLKESSHSWKESKQPVIPGDFEQAIECLEKAANTRTEILKKELIRDDLETSLRSLKEAQSSFKEVDKKVISKDVQAMMVGSLDKQETEMHQVAVQTDKKNLLQPGPGPFEPAATWQGGSASPSQTLGKSGHGKLVEERTEFKLPKAPKGTVKVVINREQNKDALEKSLRGLSTSHDKAIKNMLESGDSMGVWTDTTKGQHLSDEYMSRQLTSTGSVKTNLKTEESDRVKELKEDHVDVLTSTQSIDKTAGKQQTQTCDLRNDHQKTEAFQVNNSKKTKTIEISTDTQSSKPSPTQHPVNKPVGETYEAARDFQKKALLKQEMQYSKKEIKKNNVNLQPIQQPLLVDQDISKVTEVKFSEKGQNKFKTTDKKQETDIYLESQDFLMKTNTSKDLKMAMERSFNPTNFNPENDGKDSEYPLPPPSPPPPPPSNASSEIEFPLPPPPPLMMFPENDGFPPSLSTEKIKPEFESLPSLPLPPPPVDEKSETECPSVFLPQPPPSTLSQKSAHLLSSSVPEKHSGTFLQQYSQKEASGSQHTHFQANIVKGKSGVLPPPTLPKPKLPKHLEDKKNRPSPHFQLENSLSDMECTITASNDQKRVMLATSSEHTETKQNIFRKSLEERKQLSIDSAESLSQTVPGTLEAKKKQVAPLIKSHSFPVSSGPQSPKPYLRKFKTPLMIAEEKYRQQRQELEKQKQESSYYNIVKTESQHQNIPASQKEIQKTNKEVLLHETDSACTVIQPVPTSQSNAQASGVRSDSQVSTTSAVTDTDKRSQHVLATSEDKDYRKKEVLQSSRDMMQSKSACEIKQIHQECSTRQTQQKKYLQQLHLPPNKPVSPTFKVKTIKLPTGEHTVSEADHIHECHTKQSEVDVQAIAKQQYQETRQTEASTKYSNKQSVAEKCYQLPKKEKRVVIKEPTESTEMDQERKPKMVPEKPGESREFETGKLPGSEKINQGPSMTGLKEERLIVERKQEPWKSKSAPKVVRQKVIDVRSDSETQNFQQTRVQTSESKVEHKTLPQPCNSLWEEKCLGVKGIQQRQVFSNTKDSKQEITQNKSLFSSVKVSQQDDGKRPVNVLEFLRKREELQQILSRVKEFEAEPKSGLKIFQTLLNMIPVWLISEEKREYGARIVMENNLEKVKEEITHIKTQAEEMLVSCENVIQTAMMSSKTKKQGNKPTAPSEISHTVSNVNVSYNKDAEQKENAMADAKTVHHQVSTRHEATVETHAKTQQAIQLHEKISPPCIKTRPPSPTFITIESTARRAETSAKNELSQSPKKDSCIEPPARGPTSQTARIHAADASPPPPRSRSEQLVKLKDTTAKLSQGAIPCRSVTPAPIPEKRSEIIVSPATLRRQIQIETRGRDSPPTITIPVGVNHAASGSFRDSMQAQEAVRKVETRATCVHKDGVDPSDPPLPGTQSYEAVEIVRQVGGPRRPEHTQRYAAANRTIEAAENFINDRENEINRWFREFENGPVFEAKSNRRVYVNGEANHNIKQESRTFCKEEFGLTSLGNTSYTGFSCKHPREAQEKLSVKQPQVCTETRSLSEHFSGVDAFESQTVDSKMTTSSHNSEAGKSGFDFKYAPPTYEDVIAGHILDISDSPEELRKNFQKTWQEGESVFKSLGYAASDASASDMRTTFQEESAFISETAASRQRNMYTLSKNSLSNGVPSSRQAEFS
uniref:Xin actin binding repeat containing 2 n=1 Tax=Otolemur garnettii TaxID=30611 RepID=H0XXD6_OTOGA